MLNDVWKDKVILEMIPSKVTNTSNETKYSQFSEKNLIILNKTVDDCLKTCNKEPKTFRLFFVS